MVRLLTLLLNTTFPSFNSAIGSFEGGRPGVCIPKDTCPTSSPSFEYPNVDYSSISPRKFLSIRPTRHSWKPIKRTTGSEREGDREREDKKRVNKVRRQPMPERKNGDPVLSCPSIIHRTRQRKKVKKNRHSLTDLTGHGSKG